MDEPDAAAGQGRAGAANSGAGGPTGDAPETDNTSRLVLQCAAPVFLQGLGGLAHLSGGDRLAALLTLAILEANVRHVVRDPVLALRYARFESPPPDEIRRPVSVRALAESLSLPYDAARRRVAALEATGVCVRTAKGVYIPNSALTTEANHQALIQGYQAMEALAAGLVSIAPGFDLTGGAPRAAEPSPEGAERLAVRVGVEYVLRFAERLAAVAGDVGQGLVLLAILHHNYAPVFSDPVLARRHGGLSNPPPDDLLAPVSVLALAKTLGQPFETTRRQVNRLIRGRRCVRVAGGVIVSAQAMRTALARRALLAHVGDVQRAYGALARLGLTFGGKSTPSTCDD